jgi:outer membrane usher protein
VLQVRINGIATHTPEHILLLGTGGLAALPEAFRHWRIRLPAAAPIAHEGRQYFPLHAVINLSYQIDKRAGELLLDGAPTMFIPAAAADDPTPVSVHREPAPPVPSRDPPVNQDTDPPQEVVAQVRINGITTHTAERILLLEGGGLAARPEAFQHWRIRLPAVAPVSYGGQEYYPLHAVPNLSYQLDRGAGELLLEGANYVFLPPTSAGARAPSAGPVPPSSARPVYPAPLAANAPATAAPGRPLMPQPVAAPPESKPQAECGPAAPPAELLLDVRINGVGTGVCEHLLRLSNGRLTALAGSFERWRIRLPAAKPTIHQGQEYFPLDAVEGLSYHIDEAAQELVIDGKPEIFLSTAIGGTTGSVLSPARPPPGGFFNYDLSSLNSAGNTDTNGLLEAGVFNTLGVGTGTFLWQDFGDQKGVTRLETTWTRDQPDRMNRLRLGDAIGRAGAWGRAVRFGGVQWGTSFDTQPGFIPFPLPGAQGQAVLPSTVDIYVNNALRLSRNIPAGPFGITNVPVVTGQGDVRLVVTDLLGRQQVITQPYYASQNLLREGLADYTYEIGFVRENFGLVSDDYGRFLGTATHRLGVTNYFTRELRAEVLSNQQTIGLSGVYLWPTFGVGNASLALSNSPLGTGGLVALGVQRQSRTWSFSVQDQLNSSRFAQLGLDVPSPSNPRQTLTATVGFSPTGRDSLSLSYLRQTFWGQTGNRIVTMSYSRNLGKDYYLSIFGLQSVSDSTNRSIGFMVTHPLGTRTSASAGFTHQTAGDSATAQVQRSLPEGPGFGYRLLTETGPNARNEADGSWQTNVGTYTAQASEFGGTTSYRVGASGGVAFLGGGVFPSRRINDSFAVAKAGEYPNVRVYSQNQLVAQTDSHGLAMIPHLLPYQTNSVRIEQADLPLDARVDTLNLQVTPYFRSGALARFPVEPSKGGTITILLEDGTYLPPGALVRIDGKPEEFPVAYRGQAYLTGLAETNELEVTWNGQECRLKVGLPPGAGPVPDLGTFVCKGIKP